MEYPKLSREIYVFNDGENAVHFGSVNLFPGEGRGAAQTIQRHGLREARKPMKN